MEGERTDSPGRSRPLSATRRRERDGPEVFGVIGDTTRGGGERTDGAGVNYWGLNFRRKIVWLPLMDAFRTVPLQMQGLGAQ
jgi:hypothetical protein